MSLIPDDLSVLVVEPTLIKGNKCGLLMLLNSLATALAEGTDTGEFLDLAGDRFEIIVQSCSCFEEIEAQTQAEPQPYQELERILKELINRHSLFEILTALKRLCDTAHSNNPNLNWKTDADAITVVIERIEN